MRLKQGSIQDAILEAMERDCRALRPTEIRLLAEEIVGAEVSYDTVSSFLSVASRSKIWAVQREGFGLYRIVPSTPCGEMQAI